MLGMYLDTLIIGHTFCSMLSILNKITLQMELQNFMANKVISKKRPQNIGDAGFAIARHGTCAQLT